MHIKQIRLKNKFKRFYDLTIDLGESPSRIVALVGPNGCGKSSVFDGMTRMPMDYGHILGSSGAKPGIYYSMDGHKFFDFPNNIQIIFSDDQTIQSIWEKKHNRIDSTIFSFRSSYRYNSNLDITQISAIPDIKNNAYGASNSSDIDNKMTENYQRLFIKYNNVLNDNDMRPSEAKNMVIGELNGYIGNCLDLKISDLGNIQDGRGKLFFSKNGHETPFDFNVLSSGEKEVVDIIVDLYLRQDIYNDTIYIIDEPELHLNTAIQRKLLIEIDKIIPANCQIWLATHSIGFLRALQEELNDKSSIIFFDEDNLEKLATEEVILKPITKSHKNWKKIFSTALEDLTGLLSPKRIIYCEGRKDPDVDGGEQGFDANIFNQIFQEEFPDTLFISSGGQTEPNKYAEVALMVLNKAFVNVELWLLKDRDDNTEAQREEWLGENSTRRMLKRREIENYLFDYEILSKYQLMKEKEPTDKDDYNNIIKDIEKDDVKGKEGEILQDLLGIHTGLSTENLKRELAQYITNETKIYKELKEVIFG